MDKLPLSVEETQSLNEIEIDLIETLMRSDSGLSLIFAPMLGYTEESIKSLTEKGIVTTIGTGDEQSIVFTDLGETNFGYLTTRKGSGQDSH